MEDRLTLLEERLARYYEILRQEPVPQRLLEVLERLDEDDLEVAPACPH